MKAALLGIVILGLSVTGVTAQTSSPAASPSSLPTVEKIAQKSTASTTPTSSTTAIKVGKAAALALPP